MSESERSPAEEGTVSEKKKDEEKKPEAPKRRRGEISPEAWEWARKETEREELEAGKKFPGGKPFFVPDTDEDP